MTRTGPFPSLGEKVHLIQKIPSFYSFACVSCACIHRSLLSLAFRENRSFPGFLFRQSFLFAGRRKKKKPRWYKTWPWHLILPDCNGWNVLPGPKKTFSSVLIKWQSARNKWSRCKMPFCILLMALLFLLLWTPGWFYRCAKSPLFAALWLDYPVF